MVGPMSEGVVVTTWMQAEPYMKAGQIVSAGPLAFVVLQGPSSGSLTGPTSLNVSRVTVPARCLANNEPLLLEASLVQLGSVAVAKTVSAAPVHQFQLNQFKLQPSSSLCFVMSAKSNGNSFAVPH